MMSRIRLTLSLYNFGAVIPFLLIHAGLLSVFLIPFSWKLAVLAFATYAVRMFGVTAGYHRYFSHRSYKLGRKAQFAMAVLAQTSSQKGVLWWAAHHREHHQYSDNVGDIHSPNKESFWWAHVGWVISNRYDSYSARLIKDFGKFPELRWLDKYHWVPTVLFALTLLLTGGWPAFVWGYVVSTVALFHFTFAINSVAHLWGTRRFDIPDESRNNLLLALLTMGEGWHNNHHKYMYSCRQGLRWWEVDATYYILKTLAWMGIASELRYARIAAEEQAPPSLEFANQ